MVSPDAEELRAPEGTFQKVSATGWSLGNAYTKRLIHAGLDATPSRDRNLWPRRVSIRLHERGSQRYTFHYFTVSPDDRASNLKAEYYEPLHATQPIPTEPLPFRQMLREIETAERIQLTLRPRRLSE